MSSNLETEGAPLQRVRVVAAFFLAPLFVISSMLLLSLIGLCMFGGLRSWNELAAQLFTVYLAEMFSVLPLSWYSRRTGRDGYFSYAFASLVMVTTIGGYFTYKGVEVFKSQHPFGYETSAVRHAMLRGLALFAVEGAILGVCFRAIAGRLSRSQRDLNDLREQFE